jgi:hypothetical protein
MAFKKTQVNWRKYNILWFYSGVHKHVSTRVDTCRFEKIKNIFFFYFYNFYLLFYFKIRKKKKKFFYKKYKNFFLKTTRVCEHPSKTTVYIFLKSAKRFNYFKKFLNKF